MTLERIAALGCIVCHLQGNKDVPAELHHPLSGGRRIDKDYVIPLCHLHHRPNPHCISRHPTLKKFVEAYGTEAELHARMVALYKTTYGEL